MQASGGSDDAITGINVTPLVDVILVLLIIFMATAPMLARRALNVSLPKSSKSDRIATETLRVEVDRAGVVRLDGKRFTRPDLEAELIRVVASQPAAHVAVAADEGIAYGEIITLLDVIKGAGIKRIGLEVRRK